MITTCVACTGGDVGILFNIFIIFWRVSNIQQQLALLDNESWPGMAEADRDRLQLIKEKEALLQELQLISQQRRSPEDIARLEEEKRRLEDEIQRARATSAHGATERFVNWNHFLNHWVVSKWRAENFMCLRKKQKKLAEWFVSVKETFAPDSAII